MGVSLVRVPRESLPGVCACPVAILLDLYSSRRRQHRGRHHSFPISHIGFHAYPFSRSTCPRCLFSPMSRGSGAFRSPTKPGRLCLPTCRLHRGEQLVHHRHVSSRIKILEKTPWLRERVELVCLFDYDGRIADSHLRLPTSLDRTVLPMTTASLRDMVATTPLRRPDPADRAATLDPWLSPAVSVEDLSVLLRRAIPTLTLQPCCCSYCC